MKQMKGIRRVYNDVPRCYTDPAILSPERLKRHRFEDPSPNSDNQKILGKRSLSALDYHLVWGLEIGSY